MSKAQEQWDKFMSTLVKSPDKVRLVRAFDQVTSTVVTAVVRDRIMKNLDTGTKREDTFVVAVIHDGAAADRFLLEHPARPNCFLYPDGRELNVTGTLRQPATVNQVIPKRW